MIRNYLLKLKISLKAITRIMSNPSYAMRAFWYAAGILLVLQWLFNIPLLISVAKTNFIEMPRFILEGYINIFRYNQDIIPVGLLSISVLQGIGLSVIYFIAKHDKALRRHKGGAIAVGLLGTGCAACGGSIIAPLFATLPTALSTQLSRTVGNVAIILGVLIAAYSLISIGKKASNTLAKMPTR